jgi:hypothetical protein
MTKEIIRITKESEVFFKAQGSLRFKIILDACCGSRMFWFDKKQNNTLFCDIRSYDKGFIDNRFNRELHPDMIMDFREMDFPDKSFKLVVFDPPHLIGKPDGCRMTKTYGSLNKETWQSDIKKGFDECWRVLEDYGVLIFKWSNCDRWSNKNAKDSDL